MPTDTLGSLPLSLPLPGEVIEAQRAIEALWLEAPSEVAEDVRARMESALVALAKERETWYQQAAVARRDAEWAEGLLDAAAKMLGAERAGPEGRSQVPELVQAVATSAEMDATRLRVMRAMLRTVVRYEREEAKRTGRCARFSCANAIQSVLQEAPLDAAVTADANGKADGDLLMAAMVTADPGLEPVAKMLDALFAQLPRDPRSN